MADQQHRGTALGFGANGSNDVGFGRRVETGGWFVEHDERCVANEGSRQPHTPSLAGGELVAVLADRSIERDRQPGAVERVA